MQKQIEVIYLLIGIIIGALIGVGQRVPHRN